MRSSDAAFVRRVWMTYCDGEIEYTALKRRRKWVADKPCGSGGEGEFDPKGARRCTDSAQVLIFAAWPNSGGDRKLKVPGKEHTFEVLNRLFLKGFECDHFK